jgi:hypothetical protein
LTASNINGNIVNVTTVTAVNLVCTYLTATNFSAGSGITWNTLTASGTASGDNGYILNSNSNLTLSLPFTASVGKIVRVSGLGSGGWTISQVAGQKIHFGNIDTTLGLSGSLSSTHTRDAIEMVCCVLNSEYNIVGSIGNINIV